MRSWSRGGSVAVQMQSAGSKTAEVVDVVVCSQPCSQRRLHNRSFGSVVNQTGHGAPRYVQYAQYVRHPLRVSNISFTYPLFTRYLSLTVCVCVYISCLQLDETYHIAQCGTVS